MKHVLAAVVGTAVFGAVFFHNGVSLGSETQRALRAGTATVDITPEEPVRMAGYASRKELSTGVHDPLRVRVVFFESGEDRLVFVSTDVIGFYNGTSEYLRQAILRECTLKPHELFLSAIHTHSAPSLGIDEKNTHPNNLRYTEVLRKKLVDAVNTAQRNSMPAQIGVGTGHSAVGANRREVRNTQDGDRSIVLGRNPYGPADRDVQVMKVADAGGRTMAVMFDYATHATCLGPRNLAISGDVLGLAEQFVEKVIGQDAICPAFAGASGNIDPWFRVLPGFKEQSPWIPEPVLLGTLLGEEVVHVFGRIECSGEHVEIGSAFRLLELPARTAGDGSDTDNGDVVKLALTVGRVGETAFVGIGGEVLTEIGMEIKTASPFRDTWVITHCNGASGYLPPKELYPEGGYEVTTSRFSPDAAETVVKQALEMLRELRRKNAQTARAK